MTPATSRVRRARFSSRGSRVSPRGSVTFFDRLAVVVGLVFLLRFDVGAAQGAAAYTGDDRWLLHVVVAMVVIVIVVMVMVVVVRWLV